MVHADYEQLAQPAAGVEVAIETGDFLGGFLGTVCQAHQLQVAGQDVVIGFQLLAHELQLATWIIESDQRLKMTRHFQLRRSRDAATLLRARTTFVCIELSSGRPKRMPPEFVEGYGRALLPA